MKSPDESSRYPKPDEVLEGIGDKAVEAFARTVQRARVDLRDYRRVFPQWVVDHSERGLANWIHDRLWAHLVEQVDAIPGMETVEHGVTREVVIGLTYRFRVKRHDETGNVQSYATPTFLDFVLQPESQLPGMEETRLIAGYEWDKELREIGNAIMSLRDGKDNIIWAATLPEVDDGAAEGDAGAPVITPTQPSPIAPVVEISPEIGKERGDTTGSE
jgi:hypothetical protein